MAKTVYAILLISILFVVGYTIIIPISNVAAAPPSDIPAVDKDAVPDWKIRVFIEVDDEETKNGLKARADVLERHNFPNGFSAMIPAGAKEKIESILGVSVHDVPIHHLSVVPSDQTPYGMEQIYDNTSITSTSGGAGVVIGHLDTGVDKDHPDLENRIVGCKDATKRGISGGCNDSNGHGTHTLGTAVADGGGILGTGIFGVAPEASAYVVKVCKALCFTDDIAAAIDFLGGRSIQNAKVQIITMSIGGDTESTLIREAINRNLHILYVASAGNHGPSPDSIHYPGANPHVIAVAAIDNSKTVASFSSRGIVNADDAVILEREVELSAAGVAVESTWLVEDDGYNTISGTSMAAPHIAGLAAKEWQGTADTTRAYLRTHVEDITSANGGGAGTGYDIASGYGLGHVTPAQDTTPPTLDSAATVTTTTIDVTFSEDLDGATVAGDDFTVLGHTVSSATESSPGVVTITLSTMGTGETPLVTLVGFVFDVAGNAQTTGSATATDGIAPTITSITSDAITAGILKVGNTITFTATPASTELGGSVTGSYNAQVLTWSTANLGVTFTATYTVTEGEADQGTALQISGVTMDDAAGNTSAAQAGTDVVKLIDANSPVFASATTVSTTQIAITVDTSVTDNTAAFGDFALGGVTGGSIGSIVSTSGTTITLGITGATIADSDTVTISYTRVTGSFSEASGNVLLNFSGELVTNTLDTTAPVFSSITPSTGSTVASGFSVGYMLDEASSSGSIKFKRTGGLTDTSSHVYTMMSGDLTAAAHSISQSTLEIDAGFAALVEGAIYSIDFSATDAASNTGTAQVTLITFDSTSPTTALSVTVTTAGSYLPKSFVDITVEVTSSSGFVSGASVSLKVTDPDGKVKTQSGTTDDTGTATFKYRISHKTSPGDYLVTATASAAGFDPGTVDTKFTV